MINVQIKNSRRILIVCITFVVVTLTGCSHLKSSTNKTDIAKPEAHPLITVTEVVRAQDEWANGLISIGKVYSAKGDYHKTTENLIDKLYAYNYEYGVVLFKPTKVQSHTFRRTHDSALSYFIGDNPNIPEDKGFALAPWTHIKFHNDEMYIHGDIAVAMGEYTFTNAKGEIAKVEYTFGYVKDNEGNLKIILHHSSLPYQG
jgi:hypothetical protein